MPLFIEVPLPRQESELSCICVLGVSILPLSTIFPLHFGAVSTVWYFLFLFAHLDKGELLPSLGVGRPLTIYILIFSSETPQPNELKLGRKHL